jgi:hypothetical protein
MRKSFGGFRAGFQPTNHLGCSVGLELLKAQNMDA